MHCWPTTSHVSRAEWSRSRARAHSGRGTWSEPADRPTGDRTLACSGPCRCRRMAHCNRSLRDSCDDGVGHGVCRGAPSGERLHPPTNPDGSIPATPMCPSAARILAFARHVPQLRIRQHRVVIVRFERCSPVGVAIDPLCVPWSRTDSSGCSAEVAHMLWEPTRGLRRRSRSAAHDGSSGEGLDYCAVRQAGLGAAERIP